MYKVRDTNQKQLKLFDYSNNNLSTLERKKEFLQDIKNYLHTYDDERLLIDRQRVKKIKLDIFKYDKENSYSIKNDENNTSNNNNKNKYKKAKKFCIIGKNSKNVKNLRLFEDNGFIEEEFDNIANEIPQNIYTEYEVFTYPETQTAYTKETFTSNDKKILVSSGINTESEKPKSIFSPINIINNYPNNNNVSITLPKIDNKDININQKEIYHNKMNIDLNFDFDLSLSKPKRINQKNLFNDINNLKLVNIHNNIHNKSIDFNSKENFILSPKTSELNNLNTEEESHRIDSGYFDNSRSLNNSKLPKM